MRNYLDTVTNSEAWKVIAVEWEQTKKPDDRNGVAYFKLLYKIYQKIRELDQIGKHSKVDIVLASLTTDTWLIDAWNKLKEQGPYKDMETGDDWSLPKSKNFKNFEKLLSVVSSDLIQPNVQKNIDVVNEVLEKVIDKTISSQIELLELQKQRQLQKKSDSFNQAMNRTAQTILGFVVMFAILYFIFWALENSEPVDCVSQDCEEYYQENNYYQNVVRPG